RCRFILCVDAAADPARAFADLGNAVHKCRVDFGADIDLDVSGLVPRDDGTAARSCAVGRITYADGATGTLLYLKPTLTGEEPLSKIALKQSLDHRALVRFPSDYKTHNHYYLFLSIHSTGQTSLQQSQS